LKESESTIFPEVREIEGLNKAGKNIITWFRIRTCLRIRMLSAYSGGEPKPNVHAYQAYKGSPLSAMRLRWYQQWYGVELNPEFEISCR